jgi:hypothetical protein
VKIKKGPGTGVKIKKRPRYRGENQKGPRYRGENQNEEKGPDKGGIVKKKILRIKDI